MIPVRGLEFDHARVIDTDKRPMRFVVTRIARGMVYYRPVSGGSPQCCPVEEFPRWVKIESPKNSD